MSHAHDRLASWYRRLLLAYPPSFRRRRGAEMLTTLLDATVPGQNRPTAQEAADLVLAGVRTWFRVQGVAAGFAASVAMLLGAVAGGAAGGFAGWHTVPALPSTAEVAALLQPVAPAQTSYQRWDFLFDDSPGYTDPRWTYWALGTDTHVHGQVFADLPDRTVGPQSAARALTAVGWRQLALSGDTLTMRRGPWQMELTTTFRMGEEQPVQRLSVYPDPPAAVPWLTVGGVLLGALAGWLLVAWHGRRRLGATRRAFAAAAFSLGTFALAPATLLSAAAMVAGFAAPHDPIAGWAGYAFVFARALALVGGIALLLAASPAPKAAPEPAGHATPA